MKKRFLWLFVAAFMVILLAGCSGGPSAPTNPAEVTGENFDAGKVNALVPNGWKAFQVSDVLDKYEGDYDPYALQICKGAQSEWDVFSKPYLQINYYDAETSMMQTSKDFYEDAVDVEPISLGNYTWNGFTAKSLDYPMAVLWAEDGDDQFQVIVLLENNEEKISLEDVDVQAILASIAPSNV